MKTLITIIAVVMLLLVVNIIAYAASEDYRFFLKKIKYKEEIVYEETDFLGGTDEGGKSDKSEVEILKDEILERADIHIPSESYTFIDIISGKKDTPDTTELSLPELSWTQRKFLELFSDYELEKLSQVSNLFGITTEYPDLYYEYKGEGMSIYIFPTKTYEEVQKVFEVLSYEIPYVLNPVDNFGQASFYINLDNAYRDDYVRIILKHKNKAFGLKIKKDGYNAIKELLQRLEQ